MRPPSGTTLGEAAARLRKLYDPASFAEIGRDVVTRLALYLENACNASGPVLPWQPPASLAELATSLAQQSDRGSPLPLRVGLLVDAFLEHAHRLHSPHYMGHQVPAVLPLAPLFDLLGSFANQPMAIYEMGPFATAMERAMIGTLGEYIGWPRVPAWDAVATHGGSLANLTALLSARHRHDPASWQQGTRNAGNGRRPAIVTSADSHYSIARAAGIIGLGTDAVLKAPLDSRRRLDAERLPAFLDQAARDGWDVFALVGSACSTPIGAFDPLHDLAEIARERGFWFHVDGAHGASALLSKRHRSLMAGVEGADSLTWDAHKMLFVPALATFLFFRQEADSYATFAQEAPYLFNADASDEMRYNGGLRTVECTKRSMMAGLWGVWSLFGASLFEDLIDVTFQLASDLHERLTASDDFEPMHEPQCNILCFRHRPAAMADASEDQFSEFQESLRQQIVRSGDFYITMTRLDGKAVLRVTLINPMTTTTDLDELLASLRRHGAALLAGAKPHEGR